MTRKVTESSSREAGGREVGPAGDAFWAVAEEGGGVAGMGVAGVGVGAEVGEDEARDASVASRTERGVVDVMEGMP